MLQPHSLKHNYPIDIGNGKTSDTNTVWQILHASAEGNLAAVKLLVQREPALAFAQYNYMPPIHLAAREGHIQLVDFFLALGALTLLTVVILSLIACLYLPQTMVMMILQSACNISTSVSNGLQETTGRSIFRVHRNNYNLKKR